MQGDPSKAVFLPSNNIEALEKAGGDNDKHRNLGDGSCCIFAEDQYFDPLVGFCYYLGGNWWNDRITYIRSSSNTCIQVWKDETGELSQEYCGDEWLPLDGNLSKQVSKVCCAASSAPAPTPSGPAPTPSGPAPTPGQGPSGIDGEWLQAHNSRRTWYYEQNGMGPMDLKWSNSLKDSAQNYANRLLQIGGGDDCKIEHGFQGDSYGGENLAMISGGTNGLSPDQVLTMWFDNEINLPFGQNGHATQVAYRSSHYVGCGIAEKQMNGGGKCFIQVCRYLAPGNCNINANNWVAQTLSDTVVCGPECPAEGCF